MLAMPHRSRHQLTFGSWLIQSHVMNSQDILAALTKLTARSKCKFRSPEGVVKVVRLKSGLYQMIFDGYFVCESETIDEALATVVACLKIETI
jgi:hypothetical protein